MTVDIEFLALSPLLGRSIPKPAPATGGSAAIDIRACIEAPVVIAPGERALIPSGFALAMPSNGMAGLVFARSGLAVNKGICLSNGVGLIDSDYRGEIKVGLLNCSKEPFTINPGDRIAQLAFVPVISARLIEAPALDETARGSGGFGSTGVE